MVRELRRAASATRDDFKSLEAPCYQAPLSYINMGLMRVRTRVLMGKRLILIIDQQLDPGLLAGF